MDMSTWVICCAYDRTSGYEFRDVRLSGIPHKGDILRIRKDGVANETFLIEDVEHISDDKAPARIELYIRKVSFDIKTGKTTPVKE